MSDVTTIEADVPGRYADAVSARLRTAADDDVVGRLWRKDGTLWAPEGTPEVTNRLGWLDIAERSREQLGELEGLRDELLAEGYTDAIVLGMGGSSLAPEVFRQSFGPQESGLRLHVLDSTHPDEVRKFLDGLDLDKTLMVVSSKSGGTIEPMSMYKAFSARVDGTHFVAVTDPGTSLEKLGGGFRRVFYGDPDIGGRYSALSAFGLVPGRRRRVRRRRRPRLRDRRRRGVPRRAGQRRAVARLRARRTRAPGPRQADDRRRRPAQLLRRVGRAARRASRPASWAAASCRSPTSRSSTATATTACSCTSRSTIPSNAEKLAALKEAGHPVITVRALGPSDLGRIFFLSEFAVAVAGWVLEINPFDQPNVQEAKDNTNRVLQEGSPGLDAGSLSELAEGLAPPAYYAIMGYLPYSDETEAAVARLRASLIESHGVATTWGYGPRFLHSTGQFHKGGPKVGRFLQIVDEPPQNLEVPGEPFTFGTLIRAQADGDLQTLRNHGLPAVRIDVKEL